MPKGVYDHKPRRGELYRRTSIIDRFWIKVDVKGKDECWNWKGQLLPSGYGTFWLNGKMVRTHRVAWELTYGKIKDSLDILHICDNKPCCNPNHLFKGTQADNVNDMIKKGRQKVGIGSRHHNHILTEKDVVEIRIKKQQGDTLKILADQYGVSKYTIRDLCQRKTWRQIQYESWRFIKTDK